MARPATPESARAAAVRQWSVKAARLIDARIGDARAHAWHAVTRRVAAAPDGRKTWRAAVLTRSYKAAVARLDELADELAGPGPTSLRGLIRDARADFYRRSFALWSIAPELLAPDPTPKKAGERAARGMLLYERDPRADVLAVVGAAKSGLQAAVVVAGRRDATDEQARSVLDGWEIAKAGAARRAVDDLLIGSEVAIYNLVGREMIDPKFYAED